MQCEICGSEGPTKKIVFEGNTVFACEQCQSLGKLVEEPQQAKAFVRKATFEKTQVFDAGLDIVENYGSLVRNKRQKLGLTVEELAKKIYEKESILHKIENQKHVPSDAVLKKLENFLGISLKEKN